MGQPMNGPSLAITTFLGGLPMRAVLVPLASVVLLTCLAGNLPAQTLPPPRPLPSEAPATQPVVPPVGMVPGMPPPGYPMPYMHPGLPPGYRPSAYQVWQGYGLTYQGYLRPRVFQAPYGGYYINGYPFPQVHVYPGHHFTPIGKD
jgi:hypothetical protein